MKRTTALNAKKGFNNIAVNILSQVITLILGIIIPRLVLVNLGSEANGLLTSINQVLVYVALLEAGVGTASLQALYGPVAKEDQDSISSILAATDRFYKRTGRGYFAVVLLLTFVFPFTITSELPRKTIMAVMFLSGMPGAINYYFLGKFTILLQAEGKSYIATGLTTVIHVFTSISKIILLLHGFGVVELQIMYLVFHLVQVAFILLYMKRHYTWLDLSVKPDYDAIAQSKNALVHQVSTLIFKNTDVLVLTYFCGLKAVSVYSMYSMLFGMVETLINNFSGANFILGQTFQTDRKRFLKLHDAFELYNMALTFSLFCIAGLFILPFMTLYTSGVTDVNYVDPALPYLFIAVSLLSKGRTSSNQAINYAGHFKQTQWRSMFESCINLTVSLIAVNRFGIYGVLIGTIAALLYRTNDMILYANRRILNRSPWITYRRWLLNAALFVVVTVVGMRFFAGVALDTYPKIIFWAAVSCIVVLPLFFAVVSLFDRETWRFARDLLTPYVKRVLRKT